ncbi:MAG: hypothetical protein BWK80_02740 [Desulfobacteraceae bacterium IS3]|nr:MAG: hypothetical protein BWK80_02740 [Desulfobacteraceae bacterium IS3]
MEFLYMKNEPLMARSFQRRPQSLKIYLCVTLRKTLRSLRLNKKGKFQLRKSYLNSQLKKVEKSCHTNGGSNGKLET